MEDSSIESTAFICEFGLFEYVAMPMGIKTAPSWFQRFMERTFSDFIERKVLEIYLDDTILHSDGLEAHEEDLRKPFERIQDKNIKCHLKNQNLL